MVDIVGAGMAGLLAGRMLSHRAPAIYERQSSLPNNHSAVLRFRSDVVATATGIPFRRVAMIKAALPWRNPVADALAYGAKVSGTFRSDRSMASSAVVAEDRFIAPPDFISQLSARQLIMYDHHYHFSARRNDLAEELSPVISTIPMPVLMELLDYPRRKAVRFRSQPGTNIRVLLENCDAYVSINIPDPIYQFWRLSVTGNELIIEMPPQADWRHYRSLDEIVLDALCLLGMEVGAKTTIPSVIDSEYAKITPIPEDDRHDFLYWATEAYGIFSLGRFATWRPGLLLDDLVKDVRLIDGWLDRSTRYLAARHRR